MQMLELKAKLKNKERVLGTMVTVFQNPDIAKILKECGYDFFIIDCEHGYFTFSEVERICLLYTSGLALGINTIYSAIGGIISSIILMFAAFPIAKFALKFGPAEYFALALFGLSMIIGISEKSVIKGIMMGCFGFLLATVGLDSMYAYPRFTFGNMNLLQGISYVRCV